MFAVTVTFEIKPDEMVNFLPLMQQNARQSLENEPGCQVFDICHSFGESTVFLYEIYDDKVAFDTHLATQHFKNFDAATAAMIETKDVRVFEEVIR